MRYGTSGPMSRLSFAPVDMRYFTGASSPVKLTMIFKGGEVWVRRMVSDDLRRPDVKIINFQVARGPEFRYHLSTNFLVGHGFAADTGMADMPTEQGVADTLPAYRLELNKFQSTVRKVYKNKAARAESSTPAKNPTTPEPNVAPPSGLGFDPLDASAINNIQELRNMVNEAVRRHGLQLAVGEDGLLRVKAVVLAEV